MRDLIRASQLCRTPEVHPDECRCPAGGYEIETGPGIDTWTDEEPTT